MANQAPRSRSPSQQSQNPDLRTGWAVRYIPIGALHDGKQWLTERYAINIITAKSLTNLTQQPTQQPKILAGAIGSQRQEITTVTVGTRSFDFSGLPATLTEVDSIQALQPSTNLLKTTQFILPNVKPKLADYTILHLATHAAIVPGDPKDSFILFQPKPGKRSDLEPQAIGPSAPSSPGTFSHPYYWAPFILIGNGLQSNNINPNQISHDTIQSIHGIYVV